MPIQRFTLLALAVLLASCNRKTPDEATQNTAGDLDGVYAPGAEGLFDTETIVIEGDEFHWWFSTDEPLPKVFPLSGSFKREGDDLRLVYSISGEMIEDVSSVFPPTRIRVGDYEGITTLRTARYNGPFSEDLSIALFPTTISLSDDRSEFPVRRSIETSNPVVWSALQELEKDNQKKSNKSEMATPRKPSD